MRHHYVQFAHQMMNKELFEEKYRMIEKDTIVQTLRKNGGLGYYFMATDKNWSSNSSGWPYLLRCMYVGKHTTIELTVLCTGQQSNTIKQAFELLDNMYI